VKPVAPTWSVPDDLEELLAADPDGIWEDRRWEPILLTVMRGTTYDGRDIPLAWQVEFQPVGEVFEAANEKITSLRVEPDGYGWSDVIRSVVAQHHPEIAEEMHFGDTESDACVVWVEAESTCKILIGMVWSLIYNG
jgi:hypothetical protein